MTLAVYWDVKHQIKQNKQINKTHTLPEKIESVTCVTQILEMNSTTFWSVRN